MPFSPVRPMEPRDIDAVHPRQRRGVPGPRPALRASRRSRPAPIAHARAPRRAAAGGRTRAARGSPSAAARSSAPRSAIVREGVWGLSLLVVRPDAQSSGAGRELLDRAYEYGDGARGRIVLASPRRAGAAQLRPARARAAPGGRGRAGGRADVAMPPERPAGHARDDLPLTSRGRPRRARRRPRRRHRARCWRRAASCWCSTSAATRSCATARCALLAADRRGRRGDAPARLPGRRRHARGVGRVDHQRPGLGGRAVPRRRARAADRTAPCSWAATSARSRRTCRAAAVLVNGRISVVRMAKTQRSLTGKVVAITGGGRGIGRSIAEALTREGARVAVGDLDLESAERDRRRARRRTRSGWRSTSPTTRASRRSWTRSSGPSARSTCSSTTPGSCRSRRCRRRARTASRASSRSTCTPSSTARRRRCAGWSRAAPATSSTWPRSPAAAASRTSPPTARPSTAWSGSRRPCARSCAAPASRSPW